MEVIDVTEMPMREDARFANDDVFYHEVVARRSQMINFMTSLGIKTMRTQIQNKESTVFKILVQH
jgi:hypothetical protein